jgi:two-component system nitrate/nitrite sensor histidine kinase NarX
MFRSLRAQLGAIFIGFLLLVAASVTATFLAIRGQAGDATLINVAGRQRMLTQQIVALALTQPDSPDLSNAIQRFEQNLFALRDGGLGVDSTGDSITLPPAPDLDLRAQLDAAVESWADFQRRLQPVDAPALQAASVRLLAQLDAIVGEFEARAQSKLAALQLAQLVFFAAALLLLAWGYLFTRRRFVRPLAALGDDARRMASGELDQPIGAQADDELGLLAQAFEAMRTEVAAARDELEARIAQRTRELVALHEVSREISARLDIDYVLRSVTDKAREMVKSDLAVLCLLDETAQTLSLKAVSGPPEAVSQTRLPAQQPPAAMVLAGREALSCSPADCRGACEMLRAIYRVSHLAAPLQVGERVIGALCVGSARPGAFSADAQHFLTKQAERVAALEERQRIAAEMHDGLAQTMSYLELKAGQVAAEVEAGRTPQALADLQHTREVIRQTTRQVRRTIASLDEDDPKRQSLQDRLAELLAELSADGQTPIEVIDAAPAQLYLPPDDAVQVLRVAREAVLNARRHAHAQHIRVRLERRASEAVLSVEDDGQGFDPESPATDGERHFGLSIMRARAARIGGQLTLDSTPGHGARVVMSWPIDGRAEGE